MRDILEWPVSERCLARDSASRAVNLGKTAAAPATAAVDSERIGRGESMPPALANPADRFMTIKSLIASLTQQEDLNFLLTNRIPRAAVTRFIGWFSKIEQPLIRDLSIACWRMFSDLDLSEAQQDRASRACTIALPANCSPGLRPYDPDPVDRGQPERRHRRRASARSPTPNCSRSRARRIRCSICSAIPLWSRRTATGASSRCG